MNLLPSMPYRTPMNPHLTTILFNREYGSAWTFRCGYCAKTFRIDSRGFLRGTSFFKHLCEEKGAEITVAAPTANEEDLGEGPSEAAGDVDEAVALPPPAYNPGSNRGSGNG